jgi:hypothetical protein
MAVSSRPVGDAAADQPARFFSRLFCEKLPRDLLYPYF